MRRLAGLVVGIVLITAGLAGCAFSDPRISGTPPSPSTDAVIAAQFTAAANDVGTARLAVVTAAGANAGAGKWADMAATLGSSYQVLTGPDPINRIASTSTATPGSLATSPSTTAGSANTSLTTLRDDALANAKAATGRTAAFWASLAASAEQVRLGLTGPYGTPAPVDPSATIETQDESTAVAALLTQYDGAIFGLRAALAFLGSADDQSTFESILASLQSDRATLANLTGPTPAPSPSQGIFELPAGRDRAAAMQILTEAQRGLAQASAVWVASAANPATAIGYLMSNATLAMDYGLGTAVWPGWPD